MPNFYVADQIGWPATAALVAFVVDLDRTGY